MGKKSRTKGAVFEREVVNAARHAELIAHRVPLSGAVKSHPHDVTLEGLNVECKIQANGFRQLYTWLDRDGADLLAIRADRKPRLYVLREDILFNLLRDR